MGLLQQAVKTYDAMEKMGLVGKYEEGKEPLAPIGHIIATAKIEITIDRDGKFISAQKVDKKIIIPVTEESSGRTSAPSPHPICDNLGYLSGMDTKKYSLYLEQLRLWEESEYGDEKITAVYTYEKNKTIVKDLKAAELIKIEDGVIKNEKDMVCWKIVGSDEGTGDICEGEILKKYQKYYIKQNEAAEKSICFVDGIEEVLANQHLKGVVALNGNAKIISANDAVNFTYRGRFIDDKEAVTVSYIASQKTHNALKWLVANQGDAIGGRNYICWNPNGKVVPSIRSPLLKNQNDVLVPSDYKRELQTVLLGYKKDLGDVEEVVIASFDAATTGRLSVGYYNELKGSDFLERLGFWDETCCWYDSRYGTVSPPLIDIIRFAYGNQRGNDEISKMDTDDRVLNQQMQRLIKCRIEKARIPTDIVKLITEKASNLQIYNKNNRRRLLFTACAVINKFYNDYGKEVCEMALEAEKKDRSYQYGRLLAVLEKIEKDTYDREENRETNAIRLQSVFVKRPAYTAKIIIEQLKNGYYPKLKSGNRVYYDKLIGQIMEVISEFSEKDYNKALTESYLLGYYLQKNALYARREKEQEEDENE